MIDASEIVRAAESLIGIRWASGGRSIAGVDCSGFCILAASKAGLELPSYMGQYDPKRPDSGMIVKAMGGVGELLPKTMALPGMLFLSQIRGMRGATHMGVYASDTDAIHMDPFSRKAVRRSLKDLGPSIIACLRLNGVNYG